MRQHEQFGHREHLELAFTAIRARGMPGAIDHVCTTIHQMAAYQRVPRKYHHTISRAWVEIVAHHGASEAENFAEFIASATELLDKRLLTRHYRSSTLAGEAARSGWIEPDLTPFPWRVRQR